jgi:phosphoribosylformylglycinamidine synthase
VTVAIVRFPGSNCDRDCLHVVEHVVGARAVFAWHKDAALPADTRAVVLPGGFSYGDYLRTGALAARAPVVGAVLRFVDEGGPVLGICNGFQILCEAGALPGALRPNAHGQFVCTNVSLDVVGGGTGLLSSYQKDERITLPVAHGDGCYFADDATLDALEREGRIAFRYVARDANGDAIVNGARRGIAGIVGGPRRNVVGLMPHPERRSEARLGGDDGKRLLAALVEKGAP